MLEFLQTGQALYVLAAVCGLSIVTRWLTRGLYKRLIKETDNMSLTKNRNLRIFKQKTENAYQMNQGIPRIKPYLERQMYEFKCMGVTFQGWNTFSNQMTLLCFLAGGAAAFGAYWYRTDPYYIVLYGSVGILAGLFASFVDHGAGVVEKRQQLFAALDNYLENTLIYRLDQGTEETQAIPGPHLETRENIRSIYPNSFSGAAGKQEETEKQERGSGRQKNRAERMKNQLKAETQARRQKEGKPSGNQAPQEGAAGGAAQSTLQENGSGPGGESPIRNVDYLKRSLEQIAASREKGKGAKLQEDWLKELNPNEIQLIGEILKEYLT